MSDETCVSCNEPIKAGLVKAGDLPLHFKCTVPCVECQTALTSVTVRVSKDREYFCATHFPLQFLKKCATCGHRLREDEPSVKIDIKFHHASCLPQPPPPPPKEPEPEPVPEPEPAPVPEPVETGNTIGAVFHLQREEINKEIGLKWMIHDIELSDFEAEVLLRGSGAPGSFLVYYTANGRARDYNLLFWAEADDIQNISILDNNFKYQLYGHDQKFGFIGDLITHYQSNPVYKGKQLGSPCNFPEQYADPTEEDKRSPFINEIVAIRGELALMQHLYEDALKLKSDWVNKKDRAEQLADLDYTIAATEQRVELCKALTAKPAETAFGNDKFADPELLESAVSAYKAAHVAEEEMPDDDTISITSELEDIDEAEVPIAPELNSLDATLRRFYKENELVDANGHVTAANLATLVVQALPMRQKKLVERRIKKRKDIQAAFKKDELGVSHLLSLVREFFIFPKLMAVFTENAKTNTDFMTILEFKAYLKREPHLAADSENIVALFYKLADQNKKSKAQDPELAAARDMFGAHVAVTQDGFMTSLGFVQFMFTTGCAAFNPVHRKVYQDMNQPLAHYFINTGHNSYLEADQLMGPSSTDAYRKALLAGCRCVEIDLWDGPKGEPIVYHGYTMTSKIAARNVLLAIKESAFEASPYPVILSLENHLCLEQQTLFVKYCVDIFGDQLIVAASNFWESNPKELPPPESLKRKIIIKNKAHPNRGGVNPNDPSSVKAAKVISQEMSDAVVYCKSVRYATMRKATETTKCYEMSSFAEKKACKLARDESTGYIRLTAGHLVRVYPDGKRFDSSNYDPQPLWNVGIQMVALNYQTPDRSMQLNAARFAQNGNAGYVLKPEILRKPAAAKGGLEISKLKIQLVHGFQLNAPKSNNRMSRRRDRDLSPIVEVEVVGLKTLLLASASAKGGELPEWNDTFEFDVSMPDIALVRFNVFDDKTKESLGAYALPVSSLLPGFRRIPLNKYKPFAVVENTPASLFINVSFA